MATVRRGTIVQRFINALKLQVGADAPNQTSEKVVLTYDYSNAETLDIVKSSYASDFTNSTVYTVPSDQTFFLCGATLGVVTDASSPSTRTSLQISLNGEVKDVLGLITPTGTAFADNISNSWHRPIECGPGAIIRMNNTSGTASIDVRATIQGFLRGI